MSTKQEKPKYTVPRIWHKHSNHTWWLIAPDGEILDKVYKPLSGGWKVKSTGKEYATLGNAKVAAAPLKDDE